MLSSIYFIIGEPLMIDVALCPSEIQRFQDCDLSGVTAVVFDVLRATSTMNFGLKHGVEQFFPVETVEAARARKATNPDLLLAGERRGLPLEGFDLGNSPKEYVAVPGRSIVFTTTNGTVALHRMRRAAKVYVGALLNLEAVTTVLARENPGHILLVCAGTEEDFSLEDGVAAGALIDRLPDRNRSDAAMLVHRLYQQVRGDLASVLRGSRNGRALVKVGKSEDVELCAQVDVVDTVGVLEGDAVVKTFA
jgi:2-phosphosulfolactate phosphatase